MKSLAHKAVAITGAASGIGRMLAVNLAKEGCNLAIADVNAEGLQETAGLITGKVNVSTHVVDVSNREQVFAYAEEAAKHHGGIDIIINNAGIVLADFLETVPFKDFEWLFGINFWGVVYGTMAFLPYLKKQPEGHIVNVSSVNGIVPNPCNGPYCSAKFAVKGYTETLAQEMHGTNISVSCVHPGGIKTNIGRNAKVNHLYYSLSQEKAVELYDKEIFKTTADEAARIIISGIKRNKRRILVGLDCQAVDLIARVFPVGVVNLIGFVTRLLMRKYANK
jgi:NAD(P)-dependent dehydrogenase (short-subunit alcohol dehydrogenase family)